ncbi:MAG: DUF4924 family protein [Prevotella sp.]|nr:DUF4924 family protein [Prevotella sp.]MBQ2534114.1 DUF4924 family protein [Prevotella sp.]MBR2253084.1 DUF4924 family protein [Prevotella sp.]
MIISQQLRKTNIAEYVLYMWQVEDIIRAYQCDLSAIKREYISRFDLTDEQRDEMVDWYGNLIRMIREEGLTAGGHIQINKIVVQQMNELHAQLLSSPKFPFYNAEYYKVLPFIVELRNKGSKDISEIETCLNALYGVMMLRLQQKEVSKSTENAVKEITTFLGMLSDYYKKDKEEGLKFED